MFDGIPTADIDAAEEAILARRRARLLTKESALAAIEPLQVGDVIRPNYGGGRTGWACAYQVTKIHTSRRAIRLEGQPGTLYNFTCRKAGEKGSASYHFNGYEYVGDRILGPKWAPGSAGYLSNRGGRDGEGRDELTVMWRTSWAQPDSSHISSRGIWVALPDGTTVLAEDVPDLPTFEVGDLVEYGSHYRPYKRCIVIGPAGVTGGGMLSYMMQYRNEAGRLVPVGGPPTLMTLVKSVRESRAELIATLAAIAESKRPAESPAKKQEYRHWWQCGSKHPYPDPDQEKQPADPLSILGKRIKTDAIRHCYPGCREVKVATGVVEKWAWSPCYGWWYYLVRWDHAVDRGYEVQTSSFVVPEILEECDILPEVCPNG